MTTTTSRGDKAAPDADACRDERQRRGGPPERGHENSNKEASGCAKKSSAKVMSYFSIVNEEKEQRNPHLLYKNYHARHFTSII